MSDLRVPALAVTQSCSSAIKTRGECAGKHGNTAKKKSENNKKTTKKVCADERGGAETGDVTHKWVMISEDESAIPGASGSMSNASRPLPPPMPHSVSVMVVA